MVRLVNGRIRGEVAWLRGTHDAGLRESWDDVLSDSQHVNAFLRDQLSFGDIRSGLRPDDPEAHWAHLVRA